MYATIAGPPNAVTPERNKATDSADNGRRWGIRHPCAHRGRLGTHHRGRGASPRGRGLVDLGTVMGAEVLGDIAQRRHPQPPPESLHLPQQCL